MIKSKHWLVILLDAEGSYMSKAKTLMKRMIIEHNYLYFKCKYCNRSGKTPRSEVSRAKAFCSPTCEIYYNSDNMINMGESLNGNDFFEKIEPKPLEVTKKRKIKKKNKGFWGKNASAFYKSTEWLELRFKVLAKYGRACMACGETKGTMNVDHIKPRSKFPRLALEFSNMQVLCVPCNKGKSNKYHNDFRKKEIIKVVIDTVDAPSPNDKLNNEV